MNTDYPERYRVMGLWIAYCRKKSIYTQEVFAEKIDRCLPRLRQSGYSTTLWLSLEALFKI